MKTCKRCHQTKLAHSERHQIWFEKGQSEQMINPSVCGSEAGGPRTGKDCSKCPLTSPFHPAARPLSMLTHLLLGLCDSFVQHEGEVLNLPLQTVVVTGERPEGRLQAQQVHSHSWNTTTQTLSWTANTHCDTGPETGNMAWPARFSWTAFISLSALMNASSITRFFSSSRFCISASSWPWARSISPSYTRIWRRQEDMIRRDPQGGHTYRGSGPAAGPHAAFWPTAGYHEQSNWALHTYSPLSGSKAAKERTVWH